MKYSALLITGPSASGKTTLGTILACEHNYKHIEGDEIWNQLKTKNKKLGIKKKIHWNEIHDDLMQQSIKYLDKQDVVITHVVLPDIIQRYMDFYKREGVLFKVSILMPPKEEAISRSKIRKCWSKPTPEWFINTCHTLFNDSKEVNGKCFIDNSQLTIRETIEKLLQK